MTAHTILIGASTRCRSCGADVVFLNTEGGKVAPFQVDPTGRWVIDGRRALYVGDTRQLEIGVAQPTYYKSHFATCPQGDQWRRR